MPNRSGNAYALTALCPIRRVSADNESLSKLTRHRLQELGVNEHSPLAKVPNTYLARFYVLDDVFFEGHPAIDEHLQSDYLVFTANLHGDLDTYLAGMWESAESAVREIWEFCVGFESVTCAEEFVRYIKRCQVETTFFFDGSNDAPLAEQLKDLYVKQELARFAAESQGLESSALRRAFKDFVARTKPGELEPRWLPGSVWGASTENQQ